MAPPSPRPHKKPASKREPKKPPKDRTLEVFSVDIIQEKFEEQRKAALSAIEAKHRADEDEMMRLIYGPNWRNDPAA